MGSKRMNKDVLTLFTRKQGDHLGRMLMNISLILEGQRSSCLLSAGRHTPLEPQRFGEGLFVVVVVVVGYECDVC